MRKLKLLLATLALFGGVSSASAQDEDYTYKITNANMESKDGWTLEATGGNWSNREGSSPSFVLEAYAGWSSCTLTAYSIKQSVTLPSGKYRAEGYAFYRYGANANTDPSKSYAKFVAGDFSAPVVTLGGETLDETLTAYPNNTGEASAAFTNGYYKSVVNFSIESEQAIPFGYEGTHVEAKSWFICGPVKLYRTGDFDYTLYQNTYTTLKERADELLKDANYNNVTGSERTNLAAAYNADLGTESVANYQIAFSALNTAIEAFENAKDAYDAFVTEKDHATTLGVTTFPTPNTAAEALAAVNTLKVSEHTAIITKYTTDGSALFIPSWDNDNFGSASGEHWSGTGSSYFDKNGTNFTSKIFKTVTLPEGHYAFYAAARGHTAAYASVKVTIDGSTTEIPITMKGNRGRGINTSGEADFSDGGTYACNNEGFGWEWRHIAFDLAEEKEVTIAIECGAGSSWAWVSAGDTRLVTYDNIAVSKQRYESALAAAKAARDNAEYANVTGSERTTLVNAINATTPTTKDGYDDAAQVLEDALPVFTAAKANYDLYASELAVAQAISNTITVDAPTTAAEALAAFKTLKVAEYNFVKTAYPNSATSKIGEFTTWTRTGTVNGAEKNEFSPLTSQHWSGEARTYYEQPAGGWDPSGATFTANYEKVCKLPAGKYVIKVAARAASGNNTTGKVMCSAATLDAPIPNLGDSGKGITTEGVASFDEGTFANEGNGRGWVWNYLPFTLDAETEVTLTVHAEADGVMQWFSVCDGELLSMDNIATAVAYNETSSNTIEDVDVANVTMTRAIKANYNTVVLPFALTASQVASAFGAGTEVYTYSENSTDADAVTVNFTKDVSGAISANVPVLIKATTASASQVFEGVQVVAPTAAVKVAGTNFDFVGTYAPIAAIAAGDYFIGNGAVYKSAGATSINAFRAYIKGNTAGARIANFYIDGVETTAIEALEIAGEKNNGKIYNLNGQEVKNAQKGLYIMNGKKVVISKRSSRSY